MGILSPQLRSWSDFVSVRDMSVPVSSALSTRLLTNAAFYGDNYLLIALTAPLTFVWYWSAACWIVDAIIFAVGLLVFAQRRSASVVGNAVTNRVWLFAAFVFVYFGVGIYGAGVSVLLLSALLIALLVVHACVRTPRGISGAHSLRSLLECWVRGADELSGKDDGDGVDDAESGRAHGGTQRRRHRGDDGNGGAYDDAANKFRSQFRASMRAKYLSGEPSTT